LPLLKFQPSYITVLIDRRIVLQQRHPNVGCGLHCYKCFLLF